MTNDLFDRYGTLDPAPAADPPPDWDRILATIDEQALVSRSGGGLISVRPTTPTRKGLLAAASAFAVVVVLGAALVFLSRSGQPEPAGPVTTEFITPTTVAAVTPISSESLDLDAQVERSSQPIDQTNGIAAADGYLWVATEAGIVRWDLTTTSSMLFEPGSGMPSGGEPLGEIAVAPDGTIWAAGWNQRLIRFDGTTWSEPEGFAALDVVKPRCISGGGCTNALTAMAVGPDDHLYLGMGARTLVIFDGRDWTTVTVPSEAAGEEGNSWWAWDMDVAADGTLWVAAFDGVASYRAGTWAWYTAADGVPPEAASLTVAPNGDVWVLHGWPPTGEIGHFDGNTWTTHEPPDAQYEGNATAIAAGPDGTIWVVDSSSVAGASPEVRASGRVRRFDGESWTSVTVENVGDGFGEGGAVADDTGNLWIGTNWGVVGYDGSQVTALRVGGDARPAVEVPSIAVEGGTDILATTIAKPTPPVATCPAGSRPDVPGPADQDRPFDASAPAAFDREYGKVVVHLEGPTWTFDVCSNTWARMNDSGFSDSDALVYDADSDLLVTIDHGGATFGYDVDTDTWSDLTDPPAEVGASFDALYDAVSGLIVTRDLETAAMWAYDVDRDSWTHVSQGSIAPDGFRQSMAYDPDRDRIVLYAADNHIGGPPWESGGIHATWTFDLRAGVWTVEATATPELGWVSGAVYDESTHLSVFFGDGVVAGYDAAAREWRILWQVGADGSDGGPYTAISWGIGIPSWIDYDPINERILAHEGDTKGIWAFDTKTGTWIELLPPVD